MFPRAFLVLGTTRISLSAMALKKRASPLLAFCLKHICPCLFFLLLPFQGKGLAEDFFLDKLETTSRYLVQLSGQANQEIFDAVQALVAISPSPPGSKNPYIVIIVGYPRDNMRNSFFWNSDDSSMRIVGSEVVCRIARSYLRQPDIAFFYLSPVLYKSPKLFLTQHEKERLEESIRVAEPTKVMSQAGELRISFLGNQVRGQAWLHGHDPIGHEYVRYTVTFSGIQSQGLRSTKKVWKYD